MPTAAREALFGLDDRPAPGVGPKLLVVGGGGHAGVVAEAAELRGFTPVGLLDDQEAPALSRIERSNGGAPIPRLGRTDELERLGRPSPTGPDGWILGIGDLGIRKRILERLQEAAESGLTIIHPRAWVSPSARIGRGVFVGPNAVVHTGARLLDHAFVNSGAVVEHDCVVGFNSHVAPGAVVGGYVEVGDHTLIGLGARVLPGVKVGSNAVVGSGSVVRHRVPDGQRVAGVPAHELT